MKNVDMLISKNSVYMNFISISENTPLRVLHRTE